MIDWERVSRLREEVGPEDFRDVVALFLEEVDGTVAALRGGARRAQIEDELHFLKGSALNLGFVELAELCRMGEQLAAQGQPEQVDLAGVIACYERSRAAFLAGAAALLGAAA